MRASNEESFLYLKKFKSDPLNVVHALFVWGHAAPVSRAIVTRVSGKVLAAEESDSFFSVADSSGNCINVGTEDWEFTYGTSTDFPVKDMFAILPDSVEVDDMIMGRSSFGAILFVFTVKTSESSAV